MMLTHGAKHWLGVKVGQELSLKGILKGLIIKLSHRCQVAWRALRLYNAEPSLKIWPNCGTYDLFI